MILPPVARFFVKVFIRTLGVLIFLGIPATLIYVNFFGIGFGLPERVSAALSGQVVRTTIDRLSFDIFRGLIAENVRVTYLPAGDVPIARISKVIVAPNLAALFDGKVVIDELALDNADGAIPMVALAKEFSEEDEVQVKNLSAAIILRGSQLQLSYCEADIEGILVTARGRLDGIGSPAPKRPSAGKPLNLQVANQALDFVQQLKFPGKPLTVHLDIEGNLGAESPISKGTLEISSGPIMSPLGSVELINASLKYRDGVLNVPRFKIRAGGGDLQLWAELRDQLLSFSVESSISPLAFPELLPASSVADEVRLEEPPRLHMEGTYKLGQTKPKLKATGILKLRRFRFRTVPFDEVQAPFAIEDSKIFAKGVSAKAPAGTATADLLYQPGDVRLRTEARIDPTQLIPALDEKAGEILGRMEFADPAWVEIEFRGASPSINDLKGNGQLKLGRTATRGVWVDSITSAIEVERGIFTYKGFRVVSGKNSATGNFTYNIPDQLVRLANVESTLDPVRAMMWIDPRISESLRPYRFSDYPSIRGDGVIYMKTPLKNDLELSFTAPTGFTYELLGEDLKFTKAKGRAEVKGQQLDVQLRDAALMGGTVEVDSTVSLAPGNPVFEMGIKLEKVDFAKLTKLYFDYDSSEGFVSGDYKFRAKVREESKMQGQGSIRVENGNVFAIPFLGPFSEILNLIIPGVGYDPARLATADFTIADETIHSDNLEIQGNGFSLFGNGDIFFMRDKLEMDIRINAKGIPGIVLFPVSKLFEYESTGSLSDPKWRPKVIPKIPLPTPSTSPQPNKRDRSLPARKTGR